MAASTEQLHNIAIEAEKNVEALATGIAQVGAPDNLVKAVTQCAEIIRSVAKGLTKSAAQEQPEQPKQTMDEALDQHMAERNAPPA